VPFNHSKVFTLIRL